MISKQASQRVAEVVVSDRRQQNHLATGASRQQCRKACAPGPTPLTRHVDHGNGRLGTQPAGLPFNVDVQHRVTEDNKWTATRAGRHHSWARSA
jgi:hypothetical protein